MYHHHHHHYHTFSIILQNDQTAYRQYENKKKTQRVLDPSINPDADQILHIQDTYTNTKILIPDKH